MGQTRVAGFSGIADTTSGGDYLKLMTNRLGVGARLRDTRHKSRRIANLVTFLVVRVNAKPCCNGHMIPLFD